MEVYNLSDIWKIEQDILDVFHSICVENKLRYSLGYGTLLGAVRHKGFIPWDDDIDVIMPREDYDSLLNIWNERVPKEYIIQDYTIDNGYTNNFAKIRKKHTTFIQDKCEMNKKYHKGIFIDIFPCDRVATSKIGKKIQYLACAINLLYSRGYTSGSKGIIGVVERILLRTDKKNYRKRRLAAERIIRLWNDTNNQYLIACTIKDCKLLYPSDTFKKLRFIDFNQKKYYASHCYKELLKIQYGDYMKLPPVEERVWKHHPILVDLNHDFEELEIKSE